MKTELERFKQCLGQSDWQNDFGTWRAVFVEWCQDFGKDRKNLNHFLEFCQVIGGVA